MKTADIEIQGTGYYSITGITKAGIAWIGKHIPDREADCPAIAYSDNTGNVQDIADGATEDGLTVEVNGNTYLGENRVAA